MLHERSESIPQSRGLCRYCLREMWNGKRIPAGKCRSTDRGFCATCERWIQRYNEDPRLSKFSVAEQVPAERAESGVGWKDSPDRRCADLPTQFFAAELDSDDPEFVELTTHERKEQWAQRRSIAVTLCGSCPFITRCRTNAQQMGYEGLWGGVWFSRLRWEDLVTGEQGPTIHASRRAREQYEARKENAAA